MKRFTNPISINTQNLPSEDVILSYKRASGDSFHKKEQGPLIKFEKSNYNVSMKNIQISDKKILLSSFGKNSSFKNIQSASKPDQRLHKLDNSASSNCINSEKSTRIKVIGRFRPVNIIEDVSDKLSKY